MVPIWGFVVASWRRFAYSGFTASALLLGSLSAAGGGLASAATGLEVSPDTHLNTSAVTVTVTGDTFVPNLSSIVMSRSGDPAHSVNGTIDSEASDLSSIVASFDLTGALDGLYDVTVTSPVGTSGCESCFTVTAPPPSLTATQPASVIPTATARPGSLRLVNPPTGAAYQGRLRLTLSGVPNLAADHVLMSWYDGSAWTPVAFTPSGGTLVGYVGPEAGLAVGRSFDLTIPTRLAFSSTAPVGTMRIDSAFGPVTATGTLARVAANDRGDVVISGVPGAPTNVKAVAGDRRATLTWTAPTRKGSSAITGYVIKPSPSCAACTGLTSTGTGTTVKGLKNGVYYTFTVAAKNASGVGLYSTASSRVKPRA